MCPFCMAKCETMFAKETNMNIKYQKRDTKSPFSRNKYVYLRAIFYAREISSTHDSRKF